MVTHQKDIAVEMKYRGASNDGISVETNYLAAGAETGRLGRNKLSCCRRRNGLSRQRLKYREVPNDEAARRELKI
jgi:hypothetical protein